MKRDLLLHHMIVMTGGPLGVYYHMDGRIVLYCSSFCTMAMHFGWVVSTLTLPPFYTTQNYLYPNPKNTPLVN